MAFGNPFETGIP